MISILIEQVCQDKGLHLSGMLFFPMQHGSCVIFIDLMHPCLRAAFPNLQMPPIGQHLSLLQFPMALSTSNNLLSFCLLTVSSARI